MAERKQLYKQNGLHYYRPWVFFITDGEPTDEWRTAAAKVHEGEKSKAFAFFAVGVEGADFDVLRQISVRDPLHLTVTASAKCLSGSRNHNGRYRNQIPARRSGETEFSSRLGESVRLRWDGRSLAKASFGPPTGQKASRVRTPFAFVPLVTQTIGW